MSAWVIKEFRRGVITVGFTCEVECLLGFKMSREGEEDISGWEKESWNSGSKRQLAGSARELSF